MRMSRAQLSVVFISNSCGRSVAEIFIKYLLVTLPVGFMRWVVVVVDHHEVHEDPCKSFKLVMSPVLVFPLSLRLPRCQMLNSALEELNGNEYHRFLQGIHQHFEDEGLL